MKTYIRHNKQNNALKYSTSFRCDFPVALLIIAKMIY